jgi:hypothetical protein
MNKFAKRILNANKHNRNALIVGSGFGHMSNLAETVNSVFVINNESRDLRKKNIVYKDDFTGISTLSEIDFIFFDFDQYTNVEKLHTILSNNNPVIFIQSETPWPVKEYKYLRSLGYSHIENAHGMQKWTPS